jgi:hypothetical protein
MLGQKEEKLYTCQNCGFVFSNLELPRTCSNCFSCTGCEIYTCPQCKKEVVIRPMKNHGTSDTIS